MKRWVSPSNKGEAIIGAIQQRKYAATRSNCSYRAVLGSHYRLRFGNAGAHQRHAASRSHPGTHGGAGYANPGACGNSRTYSYASPNARAYGHARTHSCANGSARAYGHAGAYGSARADGHAGTYGCTRANRHS